MISFNLSCRACLDLLDSDLLTRDSGRELCIEQSQNDGYKAIGCCVPITANHNCCFMSNHCTANSYEGFCCLLLLVPLF